MTKKELASIAGYTYRRLHDIDMQQPQDGKLFVPSDDGKYDLALFVQRWVKYNVNNEAGSDRSLDEIKAIHEAVKTRKTQIEVERLEGTMVNIQDVRKAWADIAHVVTQNMIHLPRKVAPMVVSMDNVEVIAGLIEREVYSILNQIADTPVPEYAANDDERENDEEV